MFNPRRCVQPALVSCVFAAVAFAWVRPVARADEAAQETVDVHCVDGDGKPVAGAEVHLFQCVDLGDDGGYLRVGPLRSDTRGRAIGGRPRFIDDEGDFDRFIYARVPGKLVGVARSAKWKGQTARNADCRVVMQPSCSVEGKVLVPEPFDPAKVTVRVESMHVLRGPGRDGALDMWPREETFRGLNTALADIFDCQPDSKGRIHFDDVPKHGRLYLTAHGEGLAEAQWRNSSDTLGGAFAIEMKPEGIVSGKVLSPEGEPVVGAIVAVQLSARARNGPVNLSTFKAATDEHGQFKIRGLPEYDFHLTTMDASKRFVARPRDELHVPASTGLEIKVQMENPVLVSGRVLDPDGKPVERAAISAIAGLANDVALDDTLTDADGRFQLRLPSGVARLYFSSLPDGFVYPVPQVVRRLEIQSGQPSIDDLEFTLERRKADAP
jgi:hypothetical protein